jgi:hypothetical protein
MSLHLVVMRDQCTTGTDFTHGTVTIGEFHIPSVVDEFFFVDDSQPR